MRQLSGLEAQMTMSVDFTVLGVASYSFIDSIES